MRLPCEGLWGPGADFMQGRRYLHPQLISRSKFGAAETDSLRPWGPWDQLGAQDQVQGACRRLWWIVSTLVGHSLGCPSGEVGLTSGVGGLCPRTHSPKE